MKTLAISAFMAAALLGAGAQAATTAPKQEDPIKQECHKQNPKDHKAFLKCVQEHSKAATPAAATPASPAGAAK